MAYRRSDIESLIGLPLTLDNTFFDQLWKYYFSSCGGSLWIKLMIRSISENILPSFYYINQFKYKEYVNNINDKIKQLPYGFNHYCYYSGSSNIYYPSNLYWRRLFLRYYICFLYRCQLINLLIPSGTKYMIEPIQTIGSEISPSTVDNKTTPAFCMRLLG